MALRSIVPSSTTLRPGPMLQAGTCHSCLIEQGMARQALYMRAIVLMFATGKSRIPAASAQACLERLDREHQDTGIAQVDHSRWGHGYANHDHALALDSCNASALKSVRVFKKRHTILDDPFVVANSLPALAGVTEKLVRHWVEKWQQLVLEMATVARLGLRTLPRTITAPPPSHHRPGSCKVAMIVAYLGQDGQAGASCTGTWLGQAAQWLPKDLPVSAGPLDECWQGTYRRCYMCPAISPSESQKINPKKVQKADSQRLHGHHALAGLKESDHLDP